MLPCISLLDALICYCPQYVLKLFRCWLSSVRCNLLITSFILHTRDLLNQHKVILFGGFFWGKNIHSVTDYTKTHVAVSHKYSLSQMCLVTGLFLNQMQDVFVLSLLALGHCSGPWGLCSSYPLLAFSLTIMLPTDWTNTSSGLSPETLDRTGPDFCGYTIRLLFSWTFCLV